MRILSKREQALVDGWIAELKDAGFTPDQMVEVFKMAQAKWEALKQKKALGGIVKPDK